MYRFDQYNHTKQCYEHGFYAFEDCTGLKNVTIPSSIESIEDAAFAGLRCFNCCHISLWERTRYGE